MTTISTPARVPYFTRNDALKAFHRGETNIELIKRKRNRKGGAFLSNGQRAPDRGVARLVANTEAAINAFFGHAVRTPA